MFDRLTVSGVRPVHATTSGGLPNMNPVGGAIAGSAKTGCIHQSFQQQGTIAVVIFPIRRQSPCTQRQDLARESLDTNPRQDEESGVVHDPLQVALPLLVVPADPLVASLHLPGRRCPEQT